MIEPQLAAITASNVFFAYTLFGKKEAPENAGNPHPVDDSTLWTFVISPLRKIVEEFDEIYHYADPEDWTADQMNYFAKADKFQKQPEKALKDEDLWKAAGIIVDLIIADNDTAKFRTTTDQTATPKNTLVRVLREIEIIKAKPFYTSDELEKGKSGFAADKLALKLVMNTTNPVPFRLKKKEQ